MKKFWHFLISLQLSEYIHKIGVGLGTLSLGIGGLLALNQASNVLEKVISLQKKVDAIEDALIKTKVLQEREIGIIKYNKVNKALRSQSQIFTPGASKNEIGNALMLFSKSPSNDEMEVYLPKEKIQDIIYNIESIKNLDLSTEEAEGKIKSTIINNLEIGTPFNTEKGEVIK